MNRWIAGHVFWPLTERLTRRDTMRRLRRLRRSQFLPARALREESEPDGDGEGCLEARRREASE